MKFCKPYEETVVSYMMECIVPTALTIFITSIVIFSTIGLIAIIFSKDDDDETPTS